MGRKSSSKDQSRAPAATPEAARQSTPWLVIAVVAVLAVAVLFAYVRSGRVGPETANTQEPPAAKVPVEPQWAKFGPHHQDKLPPLPFTTAALEGPPDVVNAVYHYAAEHPEVLAYVPCYCGCENMGHRGNDDCFVSSRAPNGDVTGWEPHGMTWAVCLNVARDAMQMRASGASVNDIRAANIKKWARRTTGSTPTPMPPAGK